MDEQEKQALCEEVGRRVWRCRKEAGLTREALAERLALDPVYRGHRTGEEMHEYGLLHPVGEYF